MSEIAITAEGLGKRYQIGRQRELHGRLTESLWNALRSPLDLVRRAAGSSDAWIWALRDASFEIRRGDVVGIIGRNGSGKTTLLKVLSRITEPTTGTATLNGRIGSLLEVGTGFHPELTGRENVYMSGAVLGMRRQEINRKFDEIVDFAGIGMFLDTPVKRYSSGMQVRLGFAVAAHLDPEILLVDEVLAVGDAEFQKKCIGKMSELGESGRSILFVSHSMPAIRRLCERALLLDGGRIVAFGRTSDAIHDYMSSDAGVTSERRWDDRATAPGDGIAKLHSIRVTPAGGGSGEEIDIREPIDLDVSYWSSAPSNVRPLLNVDAYNDEGVCIFATTDQVSDSWRTLPSGSGLIRSTCHIPGNFFAEGRVTLNVAVVTYNPLVGHAVELNAVSFFVVDRSDGDGTRGTAVHPWPGVVRPMFHWRVERVGEDAPSD
jgi:lipopolysaccharide transport system ATP-binding protein